MNSDSDKTTGRKARNGAQSAITHTPYSRRRRALGLSYQPNRRSQGHPLYCVPLLLQRLVEAVQRGAAIPDPAHTAWVLWVARREAFARLAALPPALRTEAHLVNFAFYVEGAAARVLPILIERAGGPHPLLESLTSHAEAAGLTVPEDLIEAIVTAAIRAPARAVDTACGAEGTQSAPSWTFAHSVSMP